jgi:hypothetical protein
MVRKVYLGQNFRLRKAFAAETPHSGSWCNKPFEFQLGYPLANPYF